MGYDLNTSAYNLFIQLEVGIREFLIEIIIESGVQEWSQLFLGKQHLENVKEIGRRIYEANINQEIPDIEDLYITKLHKTIKAENELFASKNLHHPFYYLSWSELISLMCKTPNSEYISHSLGELTAKVVIENLKALNPLRNNIAHSRFISQDDFTFIQTVFSQISLLIPKFSILVNNQSKEESVGLLLSQLKHQLELIESNEMISLISIQETQAILRDCISSFWVNSIFGSILPQLKELEIPIDQYQKFRQMPGGLLSIQKLKEDSRKIFSDAKKIINGKI